LVKETCGVGGDDASADVASDGSNGAAPELPETALARDEWEKSPAAARPVLPL
jgi:hypothetical protein